MGGGLLQPSPRRGLGAAPPGDTLPRVRCWQALAATAEDGPSRVRAVARFPRWSRRMGPHAQSPHQAPTVRAPATVAARTIFISLNRAAPPPPRAASAPPHPTPPHSTLGVARRPLVPAGTTPRTARYSAFHRAARSGPRPAASPSRHPTTAPPRHNPPLPAPVAAPSCTRAGSDGGRGAPRHRVGGGHGTPPPRGPPLWRHCRPALRCAGRGGIGRPPAAGLTAVALARAGCARGRPGGLAWLPPLAAAALVLCLCAPRATTSRGGYRLAGVAGTTTCGLHRHSCRLRSLRTGCRHDVLPLHLGLR